MVQLAGEHPDRQRKVPAHSADFAHSVVTGIQAGPRGEPDQQPGGIIGREGIQADHLDVFQRGQVPAAGDQYQAPGGARKQWPDLIMTGGVIQYE